MPGKVQVNVQPLIADVPLFVIVTVPVNPPPQSFLEYVTVQTDAVGVFVRVAVGVMVGVLVGLILLDCTIVNGMPVLSLPVVRV